MANLHAPRSHRPTRARDERAEDTLLKGLLASTDLIVAVRNVVDGRYRSVNERFCQILGLTADRVVGRVAEDVMAPETAAQHRARDHDVLGDGQPRTTRESMVDARGNTVELLMHRFVVPDAVGRVDAVATVGVDVTELAADAARDRQADQRFRMVFDHAPIGQIFSDLTGTIVSVNDGMAAMLGYRPEEMVGRSTRDFVPVEEYDGVTASALALLDGSIKTDRAVRRFSHRTGRQVPVSVTSTLLRRGDGAPHMWVSMVLDLTDEERTRADLERAHAAAIGAARRMQLLHAIAAAANDAETLDELAPTIVAMVCEHFGWRAGCLARRSDRTNGDPAEDDTPLRISYTFGDCDGLDGTVPSIGRPDRVMVRPCDDREPVVVVPIIAATPARRAWLFRAGEVPLEESQTEVLALVGIETARVVERELAAQMLREDEQRFRSVFDSSPPPMGLSIGDTGTYAAVNSALCDLVGRPAEDIVGRSAAVLCHPEDVELLDPAGAAALADPDGRHQFELRLRHASGSIVTALVTLAWTDSADGTRQLLAQMEDVTARRRAESMLRWQADHDTLTQLANRSGLNGHLIELGRAGLRCAVLFVDLDGFKLINDTRGHEVGDEVLVAVAERLRQAVRPSDMVARFGGDEFVVVCAEDDSWPDPGDYSADYTVVGGAVRAIADRIEVVLADPIDTATGPARVTTSVGIAEGFVDPANPQDLLRRADTAMYQAKSLGRDRRAYYDIELHRRASERNETEAALRTALDDGRFIVHFQPIVRLEDSSVVGFEALVRLVNERGALVPPGDFIGVAEQSGLIVPMGAWVLHESCRALADLRQRSGRPLTMSVNVAARQAARNDLGDLVLAALDAARLPHGALTLELTESALLEADERTLAQLTMLRNQGVGISLDDFGTGYSSLSYLRRLPVSCLKIDRSFVSEMFATSQDKAIVRAVANLAEDLQLGWIAEGIETVEQRDFLSRVGRGQGQGYLFSRPLPMERLENELDLY